GLTVEVVASHLASFSFSRRRCIVSRPGAEPRDAVGFQKVNRLLRNSVRKPARLRGIIAPMKMNHVFAAQLLTLISAVAPGLFYVAALGPRVARADDFRPNSAAGPTGSVIVQDRFGGQILGFDIDQASDEGVLSEYRDLRNGNVLAAVETFSQTTGQIIKVVLRTRRQDDFVTLGVVGNSVGLVEREHAVSLAQ